MRSWHRNLRDIGWSLGATRNEGLGPNSTCSAPNLRRAQTRPEAPTTLEARKRFSDQRRPPERQLSREFREGRWFVERGKPRTNRSGSAKAGSEIPQEAIDETDGYAP